MRVIGASLDCIVVSRPIQYLSAHPSAMLLGEIMYRGRWEIVEPDEPVLLLSDAERELIVEQTARRVVQMLAEER